MKHGWYWVRTDKREIPWTIARCDKGQWFLGGEPVEASHFREIGNNVDGPQ